MIKIHFVPIQCQKKKKKKGHKYEKRNKQDTLDA